MVTLYNVAGYTVASFYHTYITFNIDVSAVPWEVECTEYGNKYSSTGAREGFSACKK